eukprot:TRINITY_DN14804_c0_g1_i1.p1 TRINITY_DN14804_c0_g1~~TRINITY_DN14804_c0_g1_i1.p1  ORF type:complete len:453 (+),score=204.66 TRINITY_DN14804_c0_g1_i1:95-1453(+)
MTEKTNWADAADEADKLASEVDSKATLEEEGPLALKNLGLRPGQEKQELMIEQSDPNSPLYSTKSFEEMNLRPELLKAIYALKYNKPSRIQEHSVPNILADPMKHFIGQAQSGTGKTCAFSLSMLSRADPAVKKTQALCCAPTRELARQIYEEVKKLAKFTTFEVLLVVKDSPVPKKTDAQIIIGTPGRIIDLIRRRAIETQAIKIYVLDEADVMLDIQGLADQSTRIQKSLPKTCQIALFSATYKDKVTQFAAKVVPNPKVVIRLKPEELSLEKIQQYYIDCKTEDNKFKILSEIYGFITVGASIIFVQTRKTAQELSKKMQAEGHQVSLLHGFDMAPEERDKVIDDFRANKTRVLITTNVLARGIDILQVSLVINFDLPLTGDHQPDPETYLHRIGRSGRFGRHGIAINLIHDDSSRKVMLAIQQHFQREIKPLAIEKIENLSKMLEEIQ